MPWRRARLLVVGEGRAGKTALLRALRNLPFQHTPSTAGIATSDVETTNIHQWVELHDTEYEKVRALGVTSCDIVATVLIPLHFNCNSTKPPPVHSLRAQAVARLVARFRHAEAQLQKVFDTRAEDEGALRQALEEAQAAGLTPGVSDVVNKVLGHLRKAILYLRVLCV